MSNCNPCGEDNCYSCNLADELRAELATAKEVLRDWWAALSLLDGGSYDVALATDEEDAIMAAADKHKDAVARLLGEE